MDPFKPYRPKPKAAGAAAVDAGAVALRAVAYIAGDEVLLARFVALTGCGGETLRQRLAEPAFLGAVLDFILGDEATTIAFAAHEGFPPETTALARAKLP